MSKRKKPAPGQHAFSFGQLATPVVVHHDASDEASPSPLPSEAEPPKSESPADGLEVIQTSDQEPSENLSTPLEIQAVADQTSEIPSPPPEPEPVQHRIACEYNQQSTLPNPWPPRDPALAYWPPKLRERWGRRANELYDSGTSLWTAEQQAFEEIEALLPGIS